MGIADHVFRLFGSPAGAGELLLILFVTKVWRSHQVVLGFAAQLLTAVATNVENVAVQVRGKPVNDKQPKKGTVD